MRARRWGRIVNISSIGARVGASSVSVAYGATKAGLEGLTRAYAVRLAPEGVTVNAVAPGLVDMEMGNFGSKCSNALVRTNGKEKVIATFHRRYQHPSLRSLVWFGAAESLSWRRYGVIFTLRTKSFQT